METNKIYHGDALEILKTFPDEFIDCCITSPPYYGLRDYGDENQIGLEDTPKLYVERLVNVFREVKRVLKKDGTLWLNLGDSYAGSGKGANPDVTPHPATLNGKQGTNKGTVTGINKPQKANTIGLKPKDLIGIPWMVAFALRADGWYLRQDIIWHKPNPMPESVTDRCTKSHEYIFLLSKSQKYYYDYESIMEKSVYPDDNRKSRVNDNAKDFQRDVGNKLYGGDKTYPNRNKRSVWTVTTKPFSEAHFATFPEDLILPCVLAGCPEYVCDKCGEAYEKIIEREQILRKRPNDYIKRKQNSGVNTINQRIAGVHVKSNGLEKKCNCDSYMSHGIILDPFMGAGTTAVLAVKNNRNYIGIELNQEYIKIAENRILEPAEIKQIGYAKTKLNSKYPTLF